MRLQNYGKHTQKISSLKLTAKAPENERLEDDPFLLGWPIFTGGAVSFKECIHTTIHFFNPLESILHLVRDVYGRCR